MSTENKETESTPDTPIQAGALTQILSQYRTDARLGHEQVSEALCLPVSSVKALENEEFDKLPEPPYIRGYLRTYSRLANKDPSEVIKIYNSLHGGTPNTATYHYSPNQGTGKTKKPLFSEGVIRIGVLVLLLSVLGLLTMQPNINQWMQETWDNFSAEQETSIQDNSLPGEDLINAKALTGDIPGNLPVFDKPEPVTTNNQGQTIENPTSNETKTTTDTTEQQDNTNTENTAKAPENTLQETSDTTEKNTDPDPDSLDEGKIKLKLVFSDEVWLRIQNNDRKTVFEALNPADSEKELILSPPLKFKVGSAHGLKIYVNGKEKDITEYTKGSIARFNIE